MARIYTKTGDQGQTSLWGGVRVSKDDMRVEAYGSLDELNSALGVLRSLGPAEGHDELLRSIQNHLFQMGAELAATDRRKLGFATISGDQVTFLEQAIDACEEQLPPLRQFILPGGSELGATCHLARTVCRRAERRVVTLATAVEGAVSGEVIKYLNRLSDLLFVLARLLNQETGAEEEPWSAPDKSQ